MAKSTGSEVRYLNLEQTSAAFSAKHKGASPTLSYSLVALHSSPRALALVCKLVGAKTLFVRRKLM